MKLSNRLKNQYHSLSQLRKALKAVRSKENILVLHEKELERMEKHLAEKEQAIAEKEQALAKLEIAIRERDKAIAERNIALKDSFIDSLTGCYNRNYFEKMMAENNNVNLNHNKLGVVFIDINNLKRVNDTLGHDAGDKLICDVANYLKANFRQNYDAVIRLGGDEFLIVCFNYRFAGNFEEILNRKMCEARCHSNLDFAYGVAVFNKNIDDDLEDTLKRADKLMYNCKKTDKCCNPKKSFDVSTEGIALRFFIRLLKKRGISLHFVSFFRSFTKMRKHFPREIRSRSATPKIHDCKYNLHRNISLRTATGGSHPRIEGRILSVLTT